MIVVRHASAGKRRAWHGDDAERPLDADGVLAAARLASALLDQPIGRILSSPYLRCLQTVAPLARARGLRTEPDHRLADDAPVAGLREILAEAEVDSLVCAHGKSIHAFLPPDYPAAKGSAWLVDRGRSLSAWMYLDPSDPAPQRQGARVSLERLDRHTRRWRELGRYESHETAQLRAFIEHARGLGAGGDDGSVLRMRCAAS